MVLNPRPKFVLIFFPFLHFIIQKCMHCKISKVGMDKSNPILQHIQTSYDSSSRVPISIQFPTIPSCCCCCDLMFMIFSNRYGGNVRRSVQFSSASDNHMLFMQVGTVDQLPCRKCKCYFHRRKQHVAAAATCYKYASQPTRQVWL